MKWLGVPIILYSVFLLLVLACAKTENPPSKESPTDYPDTQLDDATIVLSQEGKESVRVVASHIDRWEKSDSTVARTVTVIFYDNEGIQRSTLKADRGLVREESEKIAIFGHVVATNDDSTVLKTESLFWDPKTDLITTDDYVEIERADGDIVKGYGLKADKHLKEIEILKDVSGKVKNPPEPEIAPVSEPGDSADNL